MASLLPAAAALAAVLAVGAGALGPGWGPVGGAAAVTGYPPPPAAAPPPAGTGWRWPLDPAPAVVHRFDPGPARWSPGHRGVDLASSAGSPVLAAHGGVVSFAGVVAGRGVVSVDHGGGLRTTYEPVLASVRRGQRVAAGDVLGLLTGTPSHCAPPACLHWGAIGPTGYLDPLSLLGRRPPVRLLPLRGP